MSAEEYVAESVRAPDDFISPAFRPYGGPASAMPVLDVADDELDALVALPGIGPYTARAVLSFAFERQVGVVDTNVGRVLARWEGRRLRPAEAQALADELVPPGRAWAWNQAVMELGGTVCRRRHPVCAGCPARAACGWAAARPAGSLPVDEGVACPVASA